MAQGLIGKWQSDDESVLFLTDVPEEMRKLAHEQRTDLTIEKEGDGWKMTTVVGEKSRVLVYSVGQEIDTVTLMGQPIKALLTVEDGKLVERERSPEGDIIIKRYLVGGNLKTELIAKGVTAAINFCKA
ncbi:hypothetical protein ACOMHN_018830 [Nucella lapillus]